MPAPTAHLRLVPSDPREAPTVVTGEQVMAEIYEILTARLPLIPVDDLCRNALSTLHSTWRP